MAVLLVAVARWLNTGSGRGLRGSCRRCWRESCDGPNTATTMIAATTHNPDNSQNGRATFSGPRGSRTSVSGAFNAVWKRTASSRLPLVPL